VSLTFGWVAGCLTGLFRLPNKSLDDDVGLAPNRFPFAADFGSPKGLLVGCAGLLDGSRFEGRLAEGVATTFGSCWLLKILFEEEAAVFKWANRVVEGVATGFASFWLLNRVLEEEAEVFKWAKRLDVGADC
jgi:hypothetical protein